MQKRYNVVPLYQRYTSSRPLNAKPLGGNYHVHHLENPVYPSIYRVIAPVVRLVGMFPETAYDVAAYN